jgi:hypothetical protein
VDQSVWLAGLSAHLFVKVVGVSLALQLLAQAGVEGAERTVLGLALVCVLFLLAGKLIGFGNLIMQGVRPQSAVSVRVLESRLRAQNVFGLVGDARTKLACEQATAPWDFGCSFEPTPQTSTTRVKFGVRVSRSGTIVELSALSPADADLPAMSKGDAG